MQLLRLIPKLTKSSVLCVRIGASLGFGSLKTTTEAPHANQTEEPHGVNGPVISIRSVPSDKLLQAVTQAIADGRGALVITSALAGLYLDPLRRILDARAAYDRARDLERTDDPRQARFACKDEQKFLNLIDQAARGIGNCLGLNGRVYLEAIAELTARGNSETPEALRRQHSQDLR